MAKNKTSTQHTTNKRVHRLPPRRKPRGRTNGATRRGQPGNGPAGKSGSRAEIPAAKPVDVGTVPDETIRRVAGELRPILVEIKEDRQQGERECDARERHEVGRRLMAAFYGGDEVRFRARTPSKQNGLRRLAKVLSGDGLRVSYTWLRRRVVGYLTAQTVPAPEQFTNTHLEALDGVHDVDERVALATKAVENGWTTRELAAEIKQKERQTQREEDYGSVLDGTVACRFPDTKIREATRKVLTLFTEALPDAPMVVQRRTASLMWKELCGRSLLPALFQGVSRDPKLSPCIQEPNPKGKDRWEPTGPRVCSTYSAMRPTCPTTCPLLGSGCYASATNTMDLIRRLDVAAAGLSADEVNEIEADLIDRMFPHGVPQDGAKGGRDLRLHFCGDCLTERGARLLAAAATRWRKRGGGRVWVYSHSWRSIPREAWGPDIHVLGSVHTADEIDEAAARGYPAAILVMPGDHGEFPEGPKAFDLPGTDTKLVPCPAQTRDGNCAECRLCLGEVELLQLHGGRGVAIAFSAHGRDADSAARITPETAIRSQELRVLH